MGFLDKAINNTKASIDSGSSKFNEKVEVEKLESKVRDKKREIDDLCKEIGHETYELAIDKDNAHQQKIEENIKKIKEAKEAIEGYEKEIEEIKAKGKEERENIKAEAQAKNEEADKQ
jgi:vacuolar-type H+-ATPase subunit I/STV1